MSGGARRTVAIASLLFGIGCHGATTSADAPVSGVYEVGSRPRAVAVADLDGDGRADVIVPNTLRVVRHEGGSWRAASVMELAHQPWMVVGDDVSGDHRNDLIVVQTDHAGVWLAGAPGFSQAPGSPMAVRGATQVATGDLDGDGVAEIAIGPWVGDEVTVLGGKDLTSRTARVCERPVGLAIADLDGDGRSELLVACPLENRLRVTTWPATGARPAPQIDPNRH